MMRHYARMPAERAVRNPSSILRPGKGHCAWLCMYVASRSVALIAYVCMYVCVWQ
jgi:hypothetical protein